MGLSRCEIYISNFTSIKKSRYMKLKLLLAGVLATFVISGGTASAQSFNDKANTFAFPLSQGTNQLFVENTLSPLKLEVKQTNTTKKDEVKPTPEATPPPPVEYVVVDGDYLDKIATEHNVSWKRLWDKNLNIENPDVIHVGDKIVIPKEDEQLADRALPAAPVQAVAATQGSSAPAQTNAVVYRGAVSSNLYDPGYCTWYVKNRRPDLPNNLGNADTWYYRAQAQGLPTGTTPRAGAAAQVRGQMHVVYVESVNGDGTIVISEMNYAGLYSLRTVTVPASNYWYIY